MANLQWVDTYQAIVLPNCATAFGTFLSRQYYMSLPFEVVEAAEIDGAESPTTHVVGRCTHGTASNCDGRRVVCSGIRVE
jgi:hypothetical protein